jgi:signal transduction histidine kinase
VPATETASGDATSEREALDHERRRLELDRRVSQRLEAVGQLSAGIAHEINTPLQYVGDSVTFLQDAVDELLRLTWHYRETLYGEAPIPVEERRRIMREAEERAEVEYLCERIPIAFARTTDGIARVRSIVQAMKRFSHSSSTEMAPADINEAIETTLTVCRNEYKYVARVDLELDELPSVTCNVSELGQVFLNLIINAAQALEDQVAAGGALGLIRILTRIEGSEVLIEIADDGPGIPPELQERIYEPFFTTKEVGKGTGQGLALARNTVERHGGSLECTSQPEQGATFTIRLPLDLSSGDMAKAA